MSQSVGSRKLGGGAANCNPRVFVSATGARAPFRRDVRAHQIALTGVVTKVEWTNPHTFMYLNVKNDKGAIEEWAIEINSPNFLRHNGWTSSTVSAGDTIICTGAPAKSGSRFMHGMTIELSNGVQLRS
jgi:hypothetical protein